jgi:5-methyltetrahydrofolate--homocysteine methyltransferase
MFHIGKNFVAMMLEKAGLEVIELGVDVPARKFVGAVKDSSRNSSGRLRP